MTFLPDFAAGTTQSDYHMERSVVASQLKKRKFDWKQIDEMMKNTFPLRRKEIVEDEPPVTEIKDRWPALFSERQVSCLTLVFSNQTLLQGI